MCLMLHEEIRHTLHKKTSMEEKPLTLEELKPYVPAWLWELKKKAKEEKEKKSR